MSQEYDVIVIGSGIGGLATASLLAQLKHQKVLVLEQHFKVGGFTHTFSRHNYKFDVGVHYIGEMQPGSRTRKLFDLVCGSGVNWQKMPEIFEKFVYPDFTIALPSSREAYEEVLCKQFPGERQALHQYFKDISAVCQAVQGRAAAGIMPSPIASAINAFNGTYQTKAIISTKAYMDAQFKDDRLKAALVSQWGDYGLPPSLSAFAIHCLVATHYLNGGYYPVGSADSIATAIVPLIKRAGGDVLVNHKVEQIVVEGGIARGVTVRTVQGETIKYSARTVISNAGLLPTYAQLLPESYRVKVDGYTDEVDSSSVTLYLGFKRSPAELGFRGENHWLHAGYDHDASYAARNNPEGKPGFGYLSFASLKDASSPSHTGQVIALASAKPFKQWRDTAWKKRGSDYEHYKERITKSLLDMTESYYPGFGDLIDFAELSTPLTVESFTGHPGGRIYGQPLTPAVMAERSFKPDTHIKNLYLTGTDILAPGVIGAFMGGVFCAARLMGATGLAEIMLDSTKVAAAKNIAASVAPESDLVNSIK